MRFWLTFGKPNRQCDQVWRAGLRSFGPGRRPIVHGASSKATFLPFVERPLPVHVPDGLIHDWIGAVSIPHTTLEQTLARVQDYDNHKKIYKPEVMDSRLLTHRK